MDRTALAAVAVSALAAAYLVSRWNADQADQAPDPFTADTPSTVDDYLESMRSTISTTLGLWRPPAQYADIIRQAELRNGIPQDVLARLLYQESRYRSDIIDGSTASPAGALGIAQFMPATARELGIDPLDPVQAINAAGSYLARQYRATGTWTAALAAYNWGVGNVQRKGLAAAPLETRNYYAQILGDVNRANGTAVA